MHGIMGQRAAFSWWDGCEETDVSACYCSMMAATCYLPHNTPRKSFRITTMATGSGLTATSMRLDLLWLSQIAMMTGTLLPAGLPDPGSLAGGCFASVSMLLKQRTVRLAASKPALPAHTRPLREYPTAHNASHVSAAEQRAHRTAPDAHGPNWHS